MSSCKERGYSNIEMKEDCDSNNCMGRALPSMNGRSSRSTVNEISCASKDGPFCHLMVT